MHEFPERPLICEAAEGSRSELRTKFKDKLVHVKILCHTCGIKN